MSSTNTSAQQTSSKGQSQPKTITCNLYNPTTARRVIHDGIEGSNRTIVIESKETKRGVTISRVIAEELRDRNRAKKDSDIQVRPQTADEPDDKDTAKEPIKEPTIS